MNNKIREVVREKTILGQHHVLVKMFMDDKPSHYEYYVGIPKEHPYYKKSDDLSSRWFKEPSLIQNPDLSKIKGSIFYNNNRDLKKAVYSLKEPFKIKDIYSTYFESESVLKHAWLSFSGNIYKFLKEDYCYYGGGMYIPTFGNNTCKKASEIAMKLLGNHFLKVKDISLKQSRLKINFER